MDGSGQISRNCLGFLARLEEVARKYGRNPAEITVVAVSKTHPVEYINEAVAAGMSHVGESKVQEALAKLGQAPRSFSLHMIGHLQSNKVKAAVGLFDIIESVDSLKLARAIDEEARAQGKTMPVLLEVNCNREPQKYGLDPDEVFDACGIVLEMKNLTLKGLMTVAPFVDDSRLIRTSFIELRNQRAAVQAQYSKATEFTELSMGMSDDWEMAIGEGSTMIRIGRALFGQRNYPQPS